MEKNDPFWKYTNQQQKNSDEKLYFGNNRGYWQLYFTYNNENYRINKNNAGFNLYKSDNGESLTIEITQHKEEYIYVKFLAPSGETWFYTDKTSMERGISIVVKNELSEEIADVCVLYAESKSKNVEDFEVEENFILRENVNFPVRTVPTEVAIKSVERIFIQLSTELLASIFHIPKQLLQTE